MTFAQLRAGLHIFGIVQAVLVCLVVIGLCVRSSLSLEFSAWNVGVLEGISVCLIALGPAVIPSLAVFAESLGTAHVLAYLEAAVIRARWKKKLAVGSIFLSFSCCTFVSSTVVHRVIFVVLCL